MQNRINRERMIFFSLNLSVKLVWLRVADSNIDYNTIFHAECVNSATLVSHRIQAACLEPKRKVCAHR